MVIELNRNLVRSHFSSQAEEYDRYALVQTRVVDRLLQLVAVETLTGRCLEIGTGTGRFSAELVKTHPALQPVVSDLAHGMTRHAAQRVKDALAVDADAGCLPFRPASFATVISSSVYQWVEDLTSAFREVERVLRPGGLFVFALFGEQSLHELRTSHQLAVNELQAGRMSHAQEFPAEAELKQTMNNSRLQCLQLFSEQEVEFHANVPDLLRSLKKIGAGNASRHRPPGLASRQVMQRMIDIYVGRYSSNSGVPATYQVIYGVARKSL